MAPPIETIGTVAAAVGALVCMFLGGFLAGFGLRREAKRAQQSTAIEPSRAVLEQAMLGRRGIDLSLRSEDAIDLLRAMAEVLKRAGSPANDTHKVLGAEHRMEARTAPPDWQAAAREIDGRGPAGLCEARNRELGEEKRLRTLGLIDAPQHTNGASIEKQLEAARQRHSREEWGDE